MAEDTGFVLVKSTWGKIREFVEATLWIIQLKNPALPRRPKINLRRVRFLSSSFGFSALSMRCHRYEETFLFSAFPIDVYLARSQAPGKEGAKTSPISTYTVLLYLQHSKWLYLCEQRDKSFMQRSATWTVTSATFTFCFLSLKTFPYFPTVAND